MKTTTDENRPLTIPKIYASNAYPLVRGNAYRTTKLSQKGNIVKVERVSDYVSVQKVKIEYNENGFSKAKILVNTNYRPLYRYVLYFDSEGKEIKAETDAAERKLWLSMQENTQK